jgi:multicomponent Na+:H+ antiporter subunit A
MEGLTVVHADAENMMTLLIAILSGFTVALVTPMLAVRLRGAIGWVLALLPATLAVYFVSLMLQAAAGTPLAVSYPWVPDLGLALALRADGLNLLFALLVSGIGTLVVCYAGGYLNGHPHLGRFYAWLLAFMAAMLGVALADNLILLFVFWELTSLSSYALIGFEHEREEARAAALQALLVTGGGGLALLAGFIILGFAAGTLEISALGASREVIQAHPLYTSALALILIGAFTKSAQFPFHFWLPNAMEAPTPVSAYLHSATMVKAGVYLLARLNPALGGTEVWYYVVGGVGALTMLSGGFLALAQTDLKRLLAYSTISALGMMTMLIGLGTPLALKATIVMLFAHALYKGALFLVAGAVDHETGQRGVTQLRGLFRAMPIIATVAGVAALSMAGVPPLFGFIAKELTYEAGLSSGVWAMAALFCGGVLFVFVAGVVGVGPFWGKLRQTPHPPHEAPFSLWLSPAVLSGLSVVTGLYPGFLSHNVFSPAASAAIGQSSAVDLALWHGITTSLALSALTLIVGVCLYLQRDRLRHYANYIAVDWGPARFYTSALDVLNRAALWQTQTLQSGYLRHYLCIIFVTTVGLMGLALFEGNGERRWLIPSLPGFDTLDARFYELALAGLVLLATVAVTLLQSSLSAVAAMGIMGYGVALIYLLFGAPDLAMTQFLVESLTVILFVLAFYHLPDSSRLSSRRTRVRDVLVALSAGALMTTLVLLTVGVQLHPSVAQYFVDTALPLGHGRNIVNVILVDFRALDTMGEITVLGIAAIGVYALLKLPKGNSE